MNPQHIAVPTETLNKLVGILQGLPYSQVAAVMAELQQGARPVNVNEPSNEEVKA